MRIDTETLTQQFAYEVIRDTVTIWRCYSRTETAEIPETIAGYPVTKIAPYAFSEHMDPAALEGKAYTGTELIPALCGNRLSTIYIPKTVFQVGRYCFYNCEHLKKISFTDTLKDWGSGVFTGCHQVDQLEIWLYGDGRSTLKDVLAELPEPVMVDYHRKKEGVFETARLMFPEFYEEGVENTPARLINLQIHGSGMLYRNCFQQRILNFAEYDTRFPYAQSQEKFEITAQLAEGRLRYPLELSEGARIQYETFVAEQGDRFAEYIIEKREMDTLEWYISMLQQAGYEKERQKELFDAMIESAVTLGWQEGLSYLMDRRHRTGVKKKHRSFDL